MTKLEKLYSIIENSKDVGVKLSEDVIRQVEQLEEKIIKDEILPALSKDIAPRLEPIKRDLVLVVEYHPGEPISVALSRKVKISEIGDAKTLVPRTSTPVRSEHPKDVVQPHEPTKHVENPTKGLRVTFSDGTVIWAKQAIITFIETLYKIGFEKVHKVGVLHCGYNLVGKEKFDATGGRVMQHEKDGWLIFSNISNATKIKDLQIISNHYNLKLKNRRS